MTTLTLTLALALTVSLTAHLVPGGKVTLRLREGGGQHAAVVFETYRASGDRWS